MGRKLDPELVDIIKELEKKEELNKENMSNIERDFLNWGMNIININPKGSTDSSSEKAIINVVGDIIKTFMGFK